MTDTLERLFDCATDTGESLDVRLNALARAIDLATDLGESSCLERADGLVARICQEDIPHSAAVKLAYFRANIWSGIGLLKNQSSQEIWDWQGEAAQRQILYLRQSAYHPGFAGLDPVFQCQVYTNLGNLLNHVGRFVDAVESWDRALALMPSFAMARGNKGHGLSFYSRALYDPGHMAIMMLAAHDELSNSLEPNAFFEGDDSQRVREGFRQSRDDIASHLDIAAIRTKLASLSVVPNNSKQEQTYRRWCLDQRLFLNPLNDLGSLSVADYDVITTPSFVTKAGKPPTLIRFFNIMKQEFVSARYMLYTGMHSDQAHYSDRSVLLTNTLDYPEYGLATEQVKVTFRMAYSLFDKIAQFINLYWKLGVRREEVAFSRIWYTTVRNNERILRDKFRHYPNWPLRGLFWLSRDLYDATPGFSDYTEPDARALDEMRNRLEHGFLSVHAMNLSSSFSDIERPGIDLFGPDKNLFAVTRSELSAKSLRILKTARAALIYLALAMHAEERRRASAQKDYGLAMPIELPTLENDWKR